MGQNAEVMPRPLNLFSGGSYNFLPFCFKETHAWFCADNFCNFVRGGDLPVSVWDARYPEHVAVRRSVMTDWCVFVLV